MDILGLRAKIVKVNKLLIEINGILLEEYQREAGHTEGFIDAGNGYKIPPLEITNSAHPRVPPPCCGKDGDENDYR